jgi:hypothetical protein
MSLHAQKGKFKTNLQVNPKKYMKSQHIAIGPYVYEVKVIYVEDQFRKILDFWKMEIKVSLIFLTFIQEVKQSSCQYG